MKKRLIIILFPLIFFGCQKEISVENGIVNSLTLPTLTTTAITSITATTAASGGTISADGGAAVTARGVCWGTSSNPEITGSHTTDGTGAGTFLSAITGLSASTVYYARAYATNSVGTAYGNEISFTSTTTSTALATLTTTAASAITMISASGGGNISTDGGASITARGICWGTTTNPVVTGNHTTDGTGIGTFVSSITGLTAATVYYVRAYATNNVGIAYGNEITFTTSSAATIPVISTTAVSAISSTTASSGGIISSDGGAAVTVRGVCWSTTANPVITGNHSTDGTGTGTFTSSITGLSQSILYHVRAYATNSVGTAYGNDISFTTLSSSPDVYVAGWEFNGSNTIATIWKNGVATTLPNGIYPVELNSVFVSGTDVYAAGYGADASVPSGNAAMSWKNGVRTILPIATGPDGRGLSIFVSGTDVYVGGYEFEFAFPEAIAKIWKNGIATKLTDGSNGASVASVYVSGTDVYAVGFQFTGAGIEVAKIWKNGIATALTNGVNDAQAYSVFVVGTDVYVGGFENNGTKDVAKIWKNGVAIPLSNGLKDESVYSIFVSGTDVYAVGGENVYPTITIAKIWKNGVATNLTNGADYAWANSVFVYGTDVYVAGGEKIGTKDVARLWKNGVPTSLSNGLNQADANSVFVK